MRKNARENFATNSPVYKESTNVFAPYYSQSSVYTLASNDGDGSEKIQSKDPRTDIYAALDYYFKHYNYCIYLPNFWNELCLVFLFECCY